MATASISPVGVRGEMLEPRVLLAVIEVDRSFGDAGTAKAFAPNASFAGDMVLVAEAEGGKLVVAGTMVQEEPRLVRLDLARFNADGTPDPTFGPGGVI